MATLGSAFRTILRNHEAFGKMTCRDWKNWLLDDAEPQFGIWF